MATKEFETLTIHKRFFFRIARDNAEYLKDITPSEELFQKSRERGVDIFTFLERRWCFEISKPEKDWAKAEDNVAIIQTPSYEGWMKMIGKKTRNMIRKAEKSGTRTEIAAPTEKLADDIWKIYNETPIRQERGFQHYGISLARVRNMLFVQPDCTYVTAYVHNELAGFVQLVHGEKITVISQILSLQKHRDKAINNALIAKVIQFCATNNFRWVMYGRIGNHPSLDHFKLANGFHKLALTRYFVPLTFKGRAGIRLGLHKDIKDSLPQPAKTILIPLYNWTSRTKMRIRLLLRR